MIIRHGQRFIRAITSLVKWIIGKDPTNGSKEARLKADRTTSSSCEIIGSQSINSICASDERCIDGGKKLKVEKGT